MVRGRRGITAGSGRFSASLLAVGTLVSLLAVAGGTIHARAADPCLTSFPDPYNTGPYKNPLRDAPAVGARIDEGVDFVSSSTTATGNVYPIGDAAIDNIYAVRSNGTEAWPNGVYISYHMCNGPAQGMEVYVAECIWPVAWLYIGATVTANDPIGTMRYCTDPTFYLNGVLICKYSDCGIETGWASTTRWVTEASAYGQPDGADHSTYFGDNFNQMLTSLNAPAGIPNGHTGCGNLTQTTKCLPAGWGLATRGAACLPRSGATQSLLVQSNPIYGHYWGPFLGSEVFTVYLERLVDPNYNWCFQIHVVGSWSNGVSGGPNASYNLNVRIACNGTLEGVGWAFDFSNNYNYSYANSDWWSGSSTACNTSWQADDFAGSFGAQITNQFGDHWNYGTSPQHTRVKYSQP